MSKKSGIPENALEETVGIGDMDFPLGHVGKRDLKRRREEQEYFTDSKGSTL